MKRRIKKQLKMTGAKALSHTVCFEMAKSVSAAVNNRPTSQPTEAVNGIGTEVGRTKVHGEGPNTHRI